MTNSEVSKMIVKLDVEIATLEAQAFKLQERRDLLKTAEAMPKSILWQLEQALEALNQISPNQIAIFKSEIDAKFAAMTRFERIEPIVVPDARPKTSNKSDKTLAAAMFGEPIKEYRQFVVIQQELAAIGIKLGKLIANYDTAKGWELDWDGSKAGLYWTTGNGWDVETLKSGSKLTGNWEGFDLMEHLDRNGIDLYPNDEELVA